MLNSFSQTNYREQPTGINFSFTSLINGYKFIPLFGVWVLDTYSKLSFSAPLSLSEEKNNLENPYPTIIVFSPM